MARTKQTARRAAGSGMKVVKAPGETYAEAAARRVEPVQRKSAFSKVDRKEATPHQQKVDSLIKLYHAADKKYKKLWADKMQGRVGVQDEKYRAFETRDAAAQQLRKLGVSGGLKGQVLQVRRMKKQANRARKAAAAAKHGN